MDEEDEIRKPVAEVAKVPEEEAANPEQAVAVSAQDSLRLMKSMDENRYSLAEYMLFEFARVDTVLEICEELERNSSDSLIKRQSAYMRYYALDVVQGNIRSGQEVLEHIKKNYPVYYQDITTKARSSAKAEDQMELKRFDEIAVLFEQGDLQGAGDRYEKLWLDESLKDNIRARACFSYAWLHDHYLFNREEAVAAYEALLNDFPAGKFHSIARERIDRITEDLVPTATETEPESVENEPGRDRERE